MNALEIKTVLEKFIRNKNIYISPRDALRVSNDSVHVWNTDPHYLPGQHWVALYIDDGGDGYYFDSYGGTPRYREFIDSLNKNCRRWLYANVRVQDDDSVACGHFVIYFLIHMNLGIPMSDILKTLKHQPDSRVIRFVRNIR